MGSFKTHNNKLHPGHVIIGDNGQPVDTIATLSGSYVFLEGSEALLYAPLSATVTLPVGIDLSDIKTAKPRYTGRYALFTETGKLYYIDRKTIDTVTRTFVISNVYNIQVNPATIDLSPGWSIAEVEIINRLATTAAAKVDSIEFRDLQFQMELDGDPVTVRGKTSGYTIEPNFDGSTDVEVEGFDPTGAKQKLRTSELGNVNADGVYSSSDNSIPASSGVITSTRNVDDSLANQTAKPTAIRGDQNLDTVSLDVSMHNHSGNNLTFIDANNSTETPLGADGLFVGAWLNAEEYSNATVIIFTDQDSAVDGLKIELSTDGVNIDDSDPYTIFAAAGAGGGNRQFSVSIPTKYFRVRFINGSTPQTAFRLQTKIHTFRPKPSSHRVKDNLSLENDAELVKSVGVGLNPNSTLVTQRSSGINSENSSTTPLGADATFVGEWVDMVGFSNISVTILTDQPSTLDGLKLEFSIDGTIVDTDDKYTILANTGEVYTAGVSTRYFRVSYTNGPTPQTSLRLQTVFHVGQPKPSSHRIKDAIDGENDATLTKAVTTGKNPNDLFINNRTGGVSNTNSTNSPLGISGEFLGEYFELSGYGGITVSCLTDQDGSLVFEHSHDGVNLIDTDSFLVNANEAFFTGVAPKTEYIRVRFINGGAAQTALSLQTVVVTTQLGPSSQPINSPLEDNSIAVTTRSILSGQREDGIFANVGLSNNNSTKVAIVDRQSEVRGRVSVVIPINNVLLSGVPSVFHTVTPGFTLYISSFLVSALNTSSAEGVFTLGDDLLTRVGFLIPSRVSGSSPSAFSSASPSLPEPLPFLTNISFVSATGTVTISGYMIGYEEPN